MPLTANYIPINLNSHAPGCNARKTREKGDSKVELMRSLFECIIMYSSHIKKHLSGRGVKGCLCTTGYMKR